MSQYNNIFHLRTKFETAFTQHFPLPACGNIHGTQMPLAGISTKQCTDPQVHSHTAAVSWSKEIGIKWLSMKIKGQNVHAENESDMPRWGKFFEGYNINR
jgi:hypothetical protein